MQNYYELTIPGKKYKKANGIRYRIIRKLWTVLSVDKYTKVTFKYMRFFWGILQSKSHIFW